MGREGIVGKGWLAVQYVWAPEIFLNTAVKLIVHLVKDRKVKKKIPCEKSLEECNFYNVWRISVLPYSNCKKSFVSFKVFWFCFWFCFFFWLGFWFFGFYFSYLNWITFSKMWVMKHFVSVHVRCQSPQVHQEVWEGCPAVLSGPEPRGLYLTNRRQGQLVLSFSLPWTAERGAGCPWIWISSAWSALKEPVSRKAKE